MASTADTLIETVADVLGASPLFASLSRDVLLDLACVGGSVHLTAGEPLFLQGDLGTALYVVMSGRVEVVITDDDRISRAVAQLGRGETVGEMGLLSGGRRTATVRALRDSAVYQLSKEGFDTLVATQPKAMLAVIRTIIDRFQRTLTGPRAVQRRRSTIAVIPAGSSPVQPAFLSGLHGALEKYGTVARIDARAVDEAVGETSSTTRREDRRHALVTRWLNEQEESHDFVIYAAGAPRGEWADRCLRQADHVFVVASAGSDSDANALEQRLQREKEALAIARVELAHVDPGGTESVEPWLTRRPAIDTTHRMSGSQDDYARLARAVADRSTALVLSGGGARGFAHVGVIRALLESGIVIDRVAGTSMGALVAAQLAAGFDPQEMVTSLRRMFVEKGIFDYRVPIVSLLAGRRARTMLTKMFGDRRIEDLVLPYFCVTTNLTTGEAAIHDRGPLVKWLSTSMSVPGVAPPLVERGELHCDGGVVDNLPLAAMRRCSSGTLIGVSVNPLRDVEVPFDGGESLPQWKIAWQRLTARRAQQQLPTIADIVYRTAILNTVRSEASGATLSDIFIEVPLREFGIFDWKSIDRIVDAGYVAAREQLARTPFVSRSAS